MNDVPHLAAEAAELVDSAKSGELFVLDAVITEACTALEFNAAYRLPRPLIHRSVSRLLSQPVFETSSLYDVTMEHYGRFPKLDYVDCLLLAASQAKAKRLVSFDKDLLKQAT